MLGLLQQSLNRSDVDLRADLELLTHCCKSTYGFACALRYRSLVDWLDGYCVARLARALAAHPAVFKRLCLADDESVLATKDASEHASTDLVLAFQHIRALVRRMDSMSQSERVDHASFWREHQEQLLRDALCAARDDKPFLRQPEWQRYSERVECGSVAPPDDPFVSMDSDMLNSTLPLPSVPGNSGYDVNSCPSSPNSKNNYNYTPTPAEIDALVAQARDILGRDDETLRAALRQNGYDLYKTIDMFL